MSRLKRSILSSLSIAIVLLFLVSCFGNGGGSSSSGGSGGGVPFNVRMAVMDHLSIDPSQGGEILSLKGKKIDEYQNGMEMWEVDIEYLPCSQCSKQTLRGLNVPVE